MSTNAMIYGRQADNTVKGIYLHSDGYLAHAGNILFHHYNTTEKVNQLLNLGDLSSLGENIEPSELVARFGFSGAYLPVHPSKTDKISKEWLTLTDEERERLQKENRDGSNTVAYARDRDEDLEIEIIPCVDDLKSRQSYQEYEYYWDGENWYYRRNRKFKKITEDMFKEI